MGRGDQLANAARQFVGAPFKLYGRDPVTGLDCLGLLIVSLKAIGVQTVGPAGYSLRNRAVDRWLRYAGEAGFVAASGEIEMGDVLLVRPGPCQHHIMIAEHPSTVIHAHAGLRRVVRQGLATNMRIAAHWRLQD